MSTPATVVLDYSSPTPLQLQLQLSLMQLQLSQAQLQISQMRPLLQLPTQIQQLGANIMSKIDDLNAAVAAENVAIGQVSAAVAAEETNVQNIIQMLKAAQGTPDVQLDPVIQALNDHSTALGAISSGLASFDPNAAPPAVPPAA